MLKANRTKTSDPWSQRGLAKVGKSRKLSKQNTHVTVEWSQLQFAVTSWVDLEADSRFLELQQKIRRIEDNLQNLVGLKEALIEGAKEYLLKSLKLKGNAYLTKGRLLLKKSIIGA